MKFLFFFKSLSGDTLCTAYSLNCGESPFAGVPKEHETSNMTVLTQSPVITVSEFLKDGPYKTFKGDFVNI